MSNFELFMTRLLKTEGGYTKDKDDPGNWTGGMVGVGELRGTKFGISAASYPRLDIANLTRPMAISIYRTDFWMRVNGDKLPGAVAYSALDGAVNSGIGRSIMWLQEAARVADDGLWGPVTATAVAAADANDLLLRYNAFRLRFMTKTKNWSLYGSGWARRIADNLLYGSEDN
jgi:lysozyme family protein